MQSAVDSARQVYCLLGVDSGIEIYAPVTENRLTDTMQGYVIEWFERRAQVRHAASAVVPHGAAVLIVWRTATGG